MPQEDEPSPSPSPAERNYIARLERDMARLESMMLDLDARLHKAEAKITRLQMFSLDRPDGGAAPAKERR
jgi:hypothetical protein